jgi:RNA polymerase-interacting CarD/CdnL/TRCF family regulator
MQFNIGDTVVHASYGIGQIVGLEKLRYLGAEARPYYVVAIENGTIWVPLDDSKGMHLRSLVRQDELDRYRKVLRDSPLPVSEDRYQRSADFSARLKTASFQTLCEVVRDLTAFGWKKKLNDYDNATLRKVTGNLSREWSLSANIPVSAVEAEIKLLLQELRQVYHPEEPPPSHR